MKFITPKTYLVSSLIVPVLYILAFILVEVSSYHPPIYYGEILLAILIILVPIFLIIGIVLLLKMKQGRILIVGGLIMNIVLIMFTWYASTPIWISAPPLSYEPPLFPPFNFLIDLFTDLFIDVY